MKSNTKTVLRLPTNHILTDWSRDGKYFVTQYFKDRANSDVRLCLMNRDGTEYKVLTKPNQLAMIGRLSPDNKRLLFLLIDLAAKDKPAWGKREFMVLDIATGKQSKVEDVPLNAEVQSYCWSPDGQRIAYTWRQRHVGKLEEINEKETESHLIVCDPDGKNQKTIATEKGPGQWFITLVDVDWR